MYILPVEKTLHPHEQDAFDIHIFLSATNTDYLHVTNVRLYVMYAQKLCVHGFNNSHYQKQT
jgi:hypothetical protein